MYETVILAEDCCCPEMDTV